MKFHLYGTSPAGIINFLGSFKELELDGAIESYSAKGYTEIKYCTLFR